MNKLTSIEKKRLLSYAKGITLAVELIMIIQTLSDTPDFQSKLVANLSKLTDTVDSTLFNNMLSHETMIFYLCLTMLLFAAFVTMFYPEGVFVIFVLSLIIRILKPDIPVRLILLINFLFALAYLAIPEFQVRLLFGYANRFLMGHREYILFQIESGHSRACRNAIEYYIYLRETKHPNVRTDMANILMPITLEEYAEIDRRNLLLRSYKELEAAVAAMTISQRSLRLPN